MTSASEKDNQALQGAIVPTFFRYLALDVLGLIAMTSAMLVDGLFIGNYVGVTALAAVNLIIPISTLLFGVGMMLSIGGSVRAGKYLGEYDRPAASAIFSKTLVSMALYGVAAVSLALAFEERLFTGLGATPELFPAMSEYYRIIMPFLLAQLIVLALYYFIRLDGYPNLVATALTIGALVNIVLDYLFIGLFGWGLTGAAFATGISQALPLPVMMLYFLKPGRRLRFAIRQRNWKEVFQAAYNGISEFINEVSGGIVALILNWMLLQRVGGERRRSDHRGELHDAAGLHDVLCHLGHHSGDDFAELRRPQRNTHGRLSADGRRHHRGAERRLHHGAADRQRADHPAVRRRRGQRRHGDHGNRVRHLYLAAVSVRRRQHPDIGLLDGHPPSVSIRDRGPVPQPDPAGGVSGSRLLATFRPTLCGGPAGRGSRRLCVGGGPVHAVLAHKGRARLKHA